MILRHPPSNEGRSPFRGSPTTPVVEPPWRWPGPPTSTAVLRAPLLLLRFRRRRGQDHLIDAYARRPGRGNGDARHAATGQHPVPGRRHSHAPDARAAGNAYCNTSPLAAARGRHEFSVEANPATLSADKVAVLADHGVNRVSLGAQSFHAPTLRVLERDHRADEIQRAVDSTRRRVGNVSVDLIFGVPGQTVDDWPPTWPRRRRWMSARFHVRPDL